MAPERRAQLLHIANANAGAECEGLREALAHFDAQAAELERLRAEVERKDVGLRAAGDILWDECENLKAQLARVLEAYHGQPGPCPFITCILCRALAHPETEEGAHPEAPKEET